MEGNASEQQNVNTAVIVDEVQVPDGRAQLEDLRIRWRSFLPGRPTIWHRATLAHLVYTHVTAEKRLADMQAALHAAGQELGNAKRNLQNDQEASANIIRQMGSEIDELKRRNENQAAMVQLHWKSMANAQTVIEDLARKLAAAEQRIAGMEADLAATSADEAEGDEILGDRVEFEDVDTYSELATEAVRLADEVQDLKARQSNSVVWLVIDEETTLAAEEKAPAITIQTSKGPIKAHEALVQGWGKMIQRDDKPLSCGARIWFETRAAVLVRA